MEKYSNVVQIRNLQPVNPFSELSKVTITDSYLSGPCVNQDVNEIYTNSDYDYKFNNKFVESYYLAFINHGNAVFSPSDLLFIFNTSFAKFIKENPKRMEKYVKNPELQTNDNKKQLEVEFPDHNLSKLKVINMMLDEIKKDMYDIKIIELLENNLSCATELEKTACNIAIMESVEKFYKFSWTRLCGFNHIKLIGEKNDWVLLKSKVTSLQEYFINDSKWNEYCRKFIKILNEFIKCFDGTYDISFFEKMIDGEYEFGFYGDRATYCNGWILDLFYGFNSSYIMSEVPNMMASIKATTDSIKSTLMAEFVGTSIVYVDSVHNNLNPNKTYLLSSHVEDNKNGSENKSDNESENSELDNESENKSENDDSENGDSEKQESDNESENDENEYNSFRLYALNRVKNNKSHVIHDYRPVLACYFK